MNEKIMRKFRDKIGLTKYHKIGPDKDREIYFGNQKILWAGTNSYTVSTEEFPLVGSIGLGPCMAIAGRDPLSNIAFISHNLPKKDLEKINDLMFNEIFHLKSKKENLEFYLISNNEDEIYEKYAKQYLDTIVPNAKIIYEDLNHIKDPKRIGKSFILDSKTGKFYASPGFIRRS